jgi:DNA-binding transcriptional MerR regulator
MSSLRTASPAARRQPSGASVLAPARSDESGALRIGDLAALAGVSPDTLRYYERRGLLCPSGRRASGYREYPPAAAAVVRFIKHAQALGFTLGEIKELLRLRGASGRHGAGLEVRDVAVTKIRDIDEKLRMLGALRGALTELVAECDQTCGAGAVADPLDCPIIAALNTPDDEQGGGHGAPVASPSEVAC